MNRIILVEDNDRLAHMVSVALQKVSIELDIFANLAAAKHALDMQEYGLLILDRGLPDGDGLVLLNSLRQQHITLPCLILTARNAIHDRIEGLESGADDYLVKPFAMDELVARVRALLRRPANIMSLSPTFEDLTLDVNNAQLKCGTKSVALAPAEVQILHILMQSSGTTVNRNKLEQGAWGLTQAVTPNALDVALHRIRRKLFNVGSQLIISNVRGLGYAMSKQNHQE
ncbi:DNA-binding response regulator [Marinomonas sp. A3A]|jgi:DNA-binding response OmpR family regulator|uniref:response regulator n=1 Tax=Marinomonas TaxID=28253 RepID=UPI001BB3373B|nr:response regulator transcription factor [Marinomonas sp. A3A]QUX93816.1 DNA-binding response regulator [Marinomonas sp. A3A]